MSHIAINNNYYLSEPAETDVPFLVKYLNTQEHYNNTLKIPFPYTEKDARAFIEFTKNLHQKFERPMCWQLKNTQGEMIGGIGLFGVYGKHSHKDEIGYWVAKPFWNTGIATAMVKVFCNYIFEHYGLSRLEAYVFSHNKPSMRVLEKCNFTNEGLKRKYFLKNNVFVDAVGFGLVR